MKHLYLLLLAICYSSLAPAQTPRTHTDSLKAPRFEFIGGHTHDFGEIKEGAPAEYTFRFRNTGRQPIIITNVSASCGCMVPDYGKEPVLPGKKGWIKAIYGTRGRPGRFEKTLYIQSNALTALDREEIYVKGRVVPVATKG